MRGKTLCAVVTLACLMAGACGSSGAMLPPSEPTEEAPAPETPESDCEVDAGDCDFDDGTTDDTTDDVTDDTTDDAPDDTADDVTDDTADDTTDDADDDPESELEDPGTYEAGNYEKCDAKYPDPDEETQFLECMDGMRP